MEALGVGEDADASKGRRLLEGEEFSKHDFSAEKESVMSTGVCRSTRFKSSQSSRGGSIPRSPHTGYGLTLSSHGLWSHASENSDASKGRRLFEGAENFRNTFHDAVSSCRLVTLTFSRRFLRSFPQVMAGAAASQRTSL